MKLKKISDELHLRALGRLPDSIPQGYQNKMQRVWEEFGLAEAEDPNEVVNLPWPEGLGDYKQTIKEAVAFCGDNGRLLDDLRRFAAVELPQLPTSLKGLSKGWHRYNPLRAGWEASEPPSNEVMVLDFETVPRLSWMPKEDFEQPEASLWVPVCAAGWAMSGNWYCWLWSPLETVNVIPFGAGNLIINHNCGYDRAFLASEYPYQDSGNRFFDTMAAWIAVRGFCNQQRAVVAMSEDEELEDFFSPGWVNETSTNGLDSVYKFYTHKTLDKGVRDLIVKQGFSFATSEGGLQEILRYAFKDVQATAEVASYLIPEWFQAQPSDVSKVAQILLGNTWLPLSPERWPSYYTKAEAKAEEVEAKAVEQVKAVVLGVLQTYLENLQGRLESVKQKRLEDAKATGKKKSELPKEGVYLAQEVAEFSSDLSKQLAQLDWTPALSGPRKGVPAWFRDLVSKAKKRTKDGYKTDFSLRWREIPALLGLTWKGEPILWGPLPELEADEEEEGSLEGFYTEAYGPLPHPEKRGKRVTNLFCKGYVKLFESGVISGPEGLEDLIQAAISTINWTSLKKRVAGVRVHSPEGYPVVLPQIVVTGTISRRCADNLWQVAANPKAKRIGTELKSMIQAPPGFKIIGADVDSQEAWIAGCMGDTDIGYCGSSALSLINLIGSKEARTDLHTKVADQIGLGRDDTKSLNYGVIYGLAVTGATNLLMKCLPDKAPEECKAIADQYIKFFKGSRSDHTREWVGGLGSSCFNKMERIASSRCPETPVLGAKISWALRGIKDFATTRINWTIQSSGVDYRDLWVVLLRYLWHRYGVEGRLLMTIHDELRAIVREDQTVKAAWLMQIAHLLIRCAFTDAFLLDCIPAGIAWHSGVDVDTVLRKDPQAPQTTPSQPEAIAPGVTWSPKQLLELLEAELKEPVAA